MSQRRMFSPSIVDSDAFLDMPISSQLLYFHLGMHADDDGFVNPRKIMRQIAVGEDDLKVLLTKRFLLPFESGVVVIKHWLIHNMIRKDRYKETMYLEEKKRLTIKENGAYTDTLATIGLPDGNHPAPQVRLGKVRLLSEAEASPANEGRGLTLAERAEIIRVKLAESGDELSPRKPAAKTPNAEKVFQIFREVFGKYPSSWKVNRTERQAAEALWADRKPEAIRAALEFYRDHRDEQYCPQVTTPYHLADKWGRLGAYKKKLGV